MCYRDDGGGGPMRYLCPESHAWLLDCNDDDYFNTSPAPGSYLGTHWNTANSSFLIGVPPVLTVTIGGNGGGLVTSDPLGIQCADLCRQWFDRDENVTLVADPDPGSYFAGWEGSDCVVSQPCILTID
ncbi:MAG: hypothetical protein ACTS5I_16805, partial [Rhodanobacter sp.]